MNFHAKKSCIHGEETIHIAKMLTLTVLQKYQAKIQNFIIHMKSQNQIIEFLNKGGLLIVPNPYNISTEDRITTMIRNGFYDKLRANLTASLNQDDIADICLQDYNLLNDEYNQDGTNIKSLGSFNQKIKDSYERKSEEQIDIAKQAAPRKSVDSSRRKKGKLFVTTY